MIRRTLLSLATLIAAFVVPPAGTALAEDCTIKNESGTCVIDATDPGKPSTDKPGTDGGKNHGDGECKDQLGQVYPCSHPDFGRFWAPGPCYIEPVPPGDITEPPPPGQAAYYCWFIAGPPGGSLWVGTEFSVIWLPRRALLTITPEQAARSVAARMNFEAINIGMSQKLSGPAGVGYVGVPVWLWAKNPSDVTVGPQHVDDEEQGIAVTIDAKMTDVVWDLGDGNTVTCGQGTPYSPLYGVSESPTCGYKYAQVSKSQPGGEYRVTATSHWELSWTAAGEQGVIPLSFTRETTLSVGEIQVVVTNE